MHVKTRNLLFISVLVGILALMGGALVGSVQASNHKNPTLPIPENPTEGFRIFYEKGCMECHAVAGSGGTAANDMTKVVTKHSFYGIAQMMWNHVPKMSEKFEEEKIQWPHITSDEMSALMPFLSYLNFFDKPGDPEEGEKVLFREKCVICHRVGKVGIVRVKSLDEFMQYRSPAFFVARFWNAGKEVAEARRAQGLKPIGFRDNDLLDIIAYIKRSALEEIGGSKISLPPPNPRRGRRLFSEKGCATCHPHAGTPRETYAGVAVGSFTQIAQRMFNHTMWNNPDRPEMPMTPQEMSDLVSYLYFLSYAGIQGTPENGERLFFEKKCATCHAINGKGATTAPDLGSSSDLKSPMDLLTGMWNSAPEKMQKEMVEAGVAWPQFGGNELDDLFAYIFSSQGK